MVGELRAMTEDEIRRMLQGIPNKKESRFTFKLGDTVRIKSGPFAAFTGKVEGINQAKSLLKVMVNIFGRSRPVKLTYLDVEKVSAP
jgi:transcription termination/antitermination protein NusG